MKKYYLLLFLTFSTLSLSAQTLVIDDQIYQVDTLKNHSVGPGTHFTSIRLTGPARIDVFFLAVDLTNPYLTFKSVLGKDSIYSMETPTALAKRKSTPGAIYLAGTNGDFYDMSIGYPVAGNMSDSEIARIPNNDRNVFAIDENKIPELGIMTYNGNVTFGSSSWPITSVNHTRSENALVLYNHHNGQSTHTNQWGTEVGIELLPGSSWGVNRTLRAKVIDVEKNKGNHVIPAGQAVLSGHGTSAAGLDQLSLGDEIDITLNLIMNGNDQSFWTQMSGGDNYRLMLKDGIVETQSVWNELHPRTAIGYSQTRDTLFLCVVDGRGESVGVTTKQLAQLMKSAGAYTALNMDGGGSSCMYIEKYGSPVNALVGGYERPVANSVFVVSSAPTDPVIAKITPYRNGIMLPRNGEYIPQFYGYNQYGVLLDMDVQNVVLSCPSEVGRIENNKFIASGMQSGDITATYNQTVIAHIHVDYLPIEGINILLDSVIVDHRSDYPIEVQASSGGNISAIASSALLWNITDPDICSVENGVLKALKNGKTLVYGTMENIKDSIWVSVEIPASNRIPMETFASLDGWTLTKSTQFSDAVFNHDNLPAHWQQGAAVNFTYQSGLVPFIRLANRSVHTYGLPDTLKIVFNAGNTSVDRAQIFIKANNKQGTVSKNFQLVPSNTDIEWSIPLNEVFDTSDRAVYPVSFDNVNFYLTSMTVGQTYTLALKEIAQVYVGVNSTAIKQASMETTFRIYPNPAREYFQIVLPDNQTDDFPVEIFDMSGRLVIKKIVQDNGLVPVENLQRGNYIVVAKYAEQVFRSKLVITK